MPDRRAAGARRPALGLLLTTLAAGAALAQRPDTARLHRTLDSLAAAHHGTVGYAVRDLDGGARLALRGDSVFPTASLIKVGVLVTLYDVAEHGQISLDDPLALLAIDKAGGSGVLATLHPGLVLQVRDAAQLMISVSDNTATNLLLQKLTVARVDAKLDSLHLANTRIHHLVMFRALTSIARDSSEKYGLGKTTPNEMAQLFALLAQGRAVSPRADSAMLAMLETNQEDELLTRWLTGVRVAHKSGADDAIRTECALFYLRTRVVACVLTKDNADQRWIVDNEPERLMGRMGAEIVRTFGPVPPGKVETP
ncbi:MAG TPA: serine hydrolase [Gemmatimonadaceae bacterium]|nr:serine hydrolase [Gemmatimonadaceae bacterium]